VTPDQTQDDDAVDRARAHRRASRWTLAGGGAVLALVVTILLAFPREEVDLADDTGTAEAGPVQLTGAQATEACLRDVAAELTRLRAVTEQEPTTSAPDRPLQVLLAHPRDGDYVLIVVDGESISRCQLNGRAVDVNTYLTSSYLTEPPADAFHFDQWWTYGAQTDRRTVVAGRIGEEVVSVTMVLPDGTEVPAAVRAGVFATTWTTPRGESWSPRFVATLEDGSETERRLDRP
jgi:hypothetical protein